MEALLTSENQRGFAAPAVITTSFANQSMTLSGEGEFAIGACAAVNEAAYLAPFDFVAMAAIGRKFIDSPHNQLPFLAMGLNTRAKQLVGNHMGDFVSNCLLDEVVLIVPVQLQVEAQFVLCQMRNTCFLTAQPETHLWARKSLFEEVFGLQIASIYTGMDLFGHSVNVWLAEGLCLIGRKHTA